MPGAHQLQVMANTQSWQRIDASPEYFMHGDASASNAAPSSVLGIVSEGADAGEQGGHAPRASSRRTMAALPSLAA